MSRRSIPQHYPSFSPPPLLRHFLILPIDVCGCGCAYMEVRVQFVEISSLLPRPGFQGLIAGR